MKLNTAIWLSSLAMLGGIVYGDIGMAETTNKTPENTGLEEATLAGGCFWCLEAIYEQLQGVVSVQSGFAGGGPGTVSYQEVCSGDTGHAEVVRVVFDPAVLSYEELLIVFFSIHDPTTPNRQGADTGTQYRSAIFWHDTRQRDTALAMIQDLTAQKVFDGKIVTQVERLDEFIPAEDYHQDYYANNSTQPYCQAVINPKIKKFREHFRSRLKSR